MFCVDSKLAIISKNIFIFLTLSTQATQKNVANVDDVGVLKPFIFSHSKITSVGPILLTIYNYLEDENSNSKAQVPLSLAYLKNL